jgi:hypothetical protein
MDFKFHSGAYKIFYQKKSLTKLLLHTNRDKNSSRFVNSITFVGK